MHCLIPKIKLFDVRHILMHFRCSILNFYNFGRNQHFLILKKANESLFSLVLFSIFKIIFKTPRVKWFPFYEEAFFKSFFKINLKRRRTSVFLALGSNIAAFFIFLDPKTYRKVRAESVIWSS